jgi:hypothetical protein
VKKVAIIAVVVVLAFVLIVIGLAVGIGARQERKAANAEAASPEAAPVPPPEEAGTSSLTPTPAQGFLYGRITTVEGTTLEGRLRWGGGEEAFWSDFFNGVKDDNHWAKNLTPDQIPKERQAIEAFGIKFLHRQRPVDLGRRFVVRFGDIARIDAEGRDVKVTLKSGTMFNLDRFESSDFDDGVHVWDAKQGEVELDSHRVRSIEFLPTPMLGGIPSRLHGTVHTKHGDFTGFVQWNRQACVGSDLLTGRSATEGFLQPRFDTIRSIAKHSPDGSAVTLQDGRELVLTQTPEVSRGNRGVYVDEPRYGRVLVSWDAFDRVDFSPTDSGPAYGDFPPARPLTGSVTTRGGARFTGRLVYDLDESETVESFDAPVEGVDFAIPFGLIASVVVSGGERPDAPRARVVLQSGEELQLERDGDLGERNAGLLIFVPGSERPEYVNWKDVAKVELDRPPAMYPAGAR